jgi:hypothetical protein
MGNFILPLTDNPFKGKSDMTLALNRICEPLKPLYSPGKARLHLANFSAGYTDEIADMEGFSRVLWGLVPLLAGGGHSELWDICLDGIQNGTNPRHPEYWGKIHDYDQRMVEMAVFGYALALIPDKIWNPLGPAAKRNLSSWLFQINRHKIYDCNWLFFRVIVNVGLKKAGAPYDAEKLNEALTRIDTFYLSDGWYSDGIGAHSDYYVAFALHFYGLIYAALMRKEDPARSAVFLERATKFASHFIDWFSDDGSALPYGRSLTYRFAQSAFWGAAAFAGIRPFSPGVIKGIVMRNFRWWLKQPIFRSDGTLSVGYRYPNLITAESYNSPGSPYWAFKAFVPLALPDDDPFWLAGEESLPQRQEITVQTAPRFVICRDGKHVAAFNAGNSFTNGHTHTASKYEKFAYSNLFGFSVPRGEYGLSQGAFDSMLALSEGDDIYRVKRTGVLVSLTDREISFVWHPWPDVSVKTHILPGLPWHVRIHIIETHRTLDAAEGGFALGMIGKVNEPLSDGVKNGVIAVAENGASGIKNLLGNGKTCLVYPSPDTNVINSHTVIPTIKYKLKPGKNVIACAVFGGTSGCTDAWLGAPCAKAAGNRLYIYKSPGGKAIFEMPLS